MVGYDAGNSAVEPDASERAITFKSSRISLLYIGVMQVVASQYILEQLQQLASARGSESTHGLVKGWLDRALNVIYAYRLELTAVRYVLPVLLVLRGIHFSNPDCSRYKWFGGQDDVNLGGLESVGIFQLGGSANAANRMDVQPSPTSTDCIMRLVTFVDSEAASETQFLDAKTGANLSVVFQPLEKLNAMFAESTVMFSTSCCPQLVYANNDDERNPIEAASIAIDQFCSQLRSVSFLAKATSSARLLSLDSVSGLSVHTLVNQLLPSEDKGAKSKRAKKSSPSSSSNPAVIDLTMMHNNSTSSHAPASVVVRYDSIRPSEESLNDSTHADFEKNSPLFHAFYPRISVITYGISTDTTSSSLHTLLERHIDAIGGQLKAFIAFARLRASASLPHIEPAHYILSDAQESCPSDIITALNMPSDSSVDWDKQFEAQWLLPSTASLQPMALPSSAVTTGTTSSVNSSGRTMLRESGKPARTPMDSLDTSSSMTESKLMDLHRFVPSPGPNYTVSSVKGSYEYYHYGQDGIDDRGWGCAYRSMQTLVSWILRQNLNIRQVPTHVEIQRMLVDMMDKPPSFVNSSQWIGAVEISMCLSQHWDVMCKILHAPTGDKIGPLYASAIVNHFETIGSPIMIGGSVLAFTILGIAIDSNNKSPNGQPDVKYLILDPHYTGPDNVQSAVGKGCSWQPSSIWKSSAFYNLCLPQTPKWDQ